jgi:hypothetical protein
MQPLLCVALNISVVWSAVAVPVNCVIFQIELYVRNPYSS